MEKEDKLTIVGGQASGGKPPLFSTAIEKLLIRVVSDETLKDELLQNRQSVLNNPEFALSHQDKTILERIPLVQLKDMVKRFSIQKYSRRTFLKEAAATVALLATGIISANAGEQHPAIFGAITQKHDTYTVNINKISYRKKIKNYYTAKSGYHFCILEICQKNISSEIQIYTGAFSLFDTDGHSYDYLEELSTFCLMVLPPGDINFGKLVYEIPVEAVPEKLVLYSVNTPTLSIQLPKDPDYED